MKDVARWREAMGDTGRRSRFLLSFFGAGLFSSSNPRVLSSPLVPRGGRERATSGLVVSWSGESLLRFLEYWAYAKRGFGIWGRERERERERNL